MTEFTPALADITAESRLHPKFGRNHPAFGRIRPSVGRSHPRCGRAHINSWPGWLQSWPKSPQPWPISLESLDFGRKSLGVGRSHPALADFSQTLIDPAPNRLDFRPIWRLAENALYFAETDLGWSNLPGLGQIRFRAGRKYARHRNLCHMVPGCGAGSHPLHHRCVGVKPCVWKTPLERAVQAFQ